MDLLLECRRKQTAHQSGELLSGSQINVTLRGDQVAQGLVPLNVLLMKLQQFETFSIRVGEWVAKRPFRRGGRPTADVARVSTPLISEPAYGSFRFTLRFSTNVQLPLFDDDSAPVSPDRVADSFYGVLASASQDDGKAFEHYIPDENYRNWFQQQVRNLAPGRHGVTEIEVERVTSSSKSVAILTTKVRERMNESLRTNEGVAVSSSSQPATLEGTLRGLHLDQGWVAISQEGKEQVCYIGSQQVYDDVVGPFVNHRVTLPGHWEGSGAGRKFFLHEIQLTSDEQDS